MRRFLIHCLLITAATIAAYLPVAGHDFVSFDDEHYLLEHDHVRNGLTSDSVHWAFTTGYMSNWHPITWLSFMLDAQFFGLDPGRFHVVNVIFHAANALLLFALLARTTGATWPSLLVAVLFALHPLHVESVAWVSQRKDVLSTCFGLLCIIAYVSYTQRGGAARYILVIILAALGLMSKPMLVTWPFVLLLFDFWPLNRIRTSQSGLLFSPPFHEGNGGGSPPHETPAPSSTHTSHTKQTTALISLHRAVIEKIPLFLLAATSSFITYHVQHAGGSMANTHAVAAAPRIANAVVSYVRYLGKTIWPTDLCILYPHPDAPGGTPWSAAQIVAAAALLVVGSD